MSDPDPPSDDLWDDISEPAKDSDELQGGYHLTKPPQTGIEGNSNNSDSVPITSSLVKCDWRMLHETTDKWWYLEARDHEFIDVILAAVLDRDIPGDPVWLFVIAPSGGMKTELLRSLSGYDKVYHLSSLTPKSFVSGKWVKDPSTGKMVLGGILWKLNGRVLVVKDFTVVLDMKDTDRYEIFAQLRDIYDGYHEKAFGTMNYAVRINATLGNILGVTPAIDAHQKCHTTMGERFLKVRQHPNSELTAKRAYENTGKEKEMRQEVSSAFERFLKGLSFENLPQPTEEQSQEVIKMARYVALMRAWVHAQVWNGKVVSLELPEPEVPTRVAKQLGKLAIGLSVVRGHTTVTEEDMNTVRRVARETAIPLRETIIEYMVEEEEKSLLPKEGYPFTYALVSKETKSHYNSIRIEIDKMIALGILEPKQKQANEGTMIVEAFKFSDSFRELLNSVQPKNISTFDLSEDKGS